MRAEVVLLEIGTERVDDRHAVAVPDTVAKLVEEFVDGEGLFRGPMIGDVQGWHHRALRDDCSAVGAVEARGFPLRAARFFRRCSLRSLASLSR